jgi:hypothetical protein
MTASHGVYPIEDDKPIPLLSIKEPIEPALPILGKYQQSYLLVATMGDARPMSG